MAKLSLLSGWDWFDAVSIFAVFVGVTAGYIVRRLLRKDNTVLFTVGERAKQSAAQAIEAAEKAQTEREKAESGRLELEKQVLMLAEKTKTRRISPEARACIFATVKGVSRGAIEIVLFDKDPEAVAFAISVRKALRDAGFEKIDFSPRGIFRAVEMFPEVIDRQTDLIFCVKDASTPPKYAALLLLCLKQNGITADGWPYNDGLAADALQIWIIPKFQTVPE